MKLQELAERSGVSTASIKHYLRAGLLPPGAKKNATTSVYSASHLHRLALISWTRVELRLSLRTISGLISAIEDPAIPNLYLMGISQQLAISASSGPPESGHRDAVAAQAASTILEAALPFGDSRTSAFPADRPGTGEGASAVDRTILDLLGRMGLPDVSTSARIQLARAATDLQSAGYIVDESVIELHLRALLEIASANTMPIRDDLSRDEICLEVIRGVTLHNRMLLAASALAHASLSGLTRDSTGAGEATHSRDFPNLRHSSRHRAST